MDFDDFDDFDADEDEDERSGKDLLDEDLDSDTRLCQACGAAIYEDAPQCAVCGHYQTAAGASKLTRWVLLTGVVVVVTLLLTLLLR